jgi:hypothetical protein
MRSAEHGGMLLPSGISFARSAVRTAINNGPDIRLHEFARTIV